MKRSKTYLGSVLSLMILTGLLAGCAAPLYEAAERGDMQGVRKLLDQGVDINETSVEYGTALSAAAAYGRVDIMKYLLDRGADINVGRGWWTPSAAASAGGQMEAIRLLLDRGADINAKSPGGQTALWWAAYAGQTRVVQLLLDQGASCCETIARELSSYDTPLKAAKSKGHNAIVRMIEQAEARQLGTAPPPVASPALAAPVQSVSRRVM
jgi:ankyrin repeat protein